MSTLSQEVSQRSGLGVFVGVVTAVIGVVMVMYPFATAQVTTAFVGGALILVSAAQFVFAFAADSVGNFFVKLLLAILYGVAGIGLAVDPSQGATALTAVLGTVLLIQACIEGIFAYEFRAFSSVSGWFVFDAIASAALGLMIVANWPSSSHWAIGTLVGMGVLFNGITRIIVSATIHHEAGAIAKATV